MAEKKGFFNFFKSLTRSTPTFTQEEANQRDYALSKEKEEAQHSEMLDVFEIAEEAPQPSPISEEIIEYCISKLSQILSVSQLDGAVTFVKKSGTTLHLDISNSADAGRVIGKEGATLDAFQTLLKAFVFKAYGLSIRVVIDSGEYRKTKENILKAQAFKAAKIVLQEAKRMELKPMGPDDRRFVHNLFQNHKRIRSFSMGEGHYRHIVLERKNG